jgi:ligand-binding sensor domain-containing protein
MNIPGKTTAAIAVIIFTLNAAQDAWESFTGPCLFNSMTQDSSRVWLGSNIGLVAIDKATGTKTMYNHTNSGMPENSVSACAVDNAGRLWVGFGSGKIAMQSNGQWTWWFDDVYGSKQASSISSFAFDKDNSVWVGTWGSGLFRYASGAWRAFPKDSTKAPSDRISALSVTADGALWIGASDSGLVKMSGTTIVRIGTPSMRKTGITCLTIDKLGNLWAGNNNTGDTSLLKIAADGTVSKAFRPNLSTDDNPTAIAFDNAGTLWFGTYQSGIATLANDSVWTQYSNYDGTAGMDDDHIAAALADKSGAVWFATVDSGAVMKYTAGSFTSSRPRVSPLPSNEINAVAAGTDGSVWIATYSGLACFKNPAWTVYTKANSILPSDDVLSVGVRGSEVWVGTTSGGLVKITGTTMTDMAKNIAGWKTCDVSAIAFEGANTVWVGTSSKQVWRYDGATWTSYDSASTQGKFPNAKILSIAVQGDTATWIGTGNRGAVRLSGTVWTSFNRNNSGLPDNEIFGIAPDKNGIVWFGTYGLAKYTGTSWRSYNFLNRPLGGFTVPAIAVDKNNIKWLSSWSLIRFDDINNVWKVYTTDSSALPSNDVTAIAIDSNQTVWAGTRYQGLVHFTPGSDAVIPRAYGATAGGRLFSVSSIFQDRLTINLPGAIGRAAGELTVTVSDVKGRQIVRIVSPASSAIVWDGRDSRGLQAACGCYIVRVNWKPRLGTAQTANALIIRQR